MVLGVCTAGVNWVRRFAEHCGVSFPLASDKSGEVSRRYDVRRRLGLGTPLSTRRVTYVIDGEGIIWDAFHNELSMSSHIERALKVLETIGQGTGLKPSPPS